jgi:hypothetical protein
VRTQNLSPDLIQKLFERQNFFSRRKTGDSAETHALPTQVDGEKSGEKESHDSVMTIPQSVRDAWRATMAENAAVIEPVVSIPDGPLHFRTLKPMVDETTTTQRLGDDFLIIPTLTPRSGEINGDAETPIINERTTVSATETTTTTEVAVETTTTTTTIATTTTTTIATTTTTEQTQQTDSTPLTVNVRSNSLDTRTIVEGSGEDDNMDLKGLSSTIVRTIDFNQVDIDSQLIQVHDLLDTRDTGHSPVNWCPREAYVA